MTQYSVLDTAHSLEKNLKTAPLNCYHCGDRIQDAPIWAHQKAFCCEGCQTVYEILQEGDLCQYYDLEQAPGQKGATVPKERYAFLDEPAIRESLLQFTDGQISVVRLYIPAVHCSSCIWLLENLNRLHKAVLRSQVNFPKKEITVTFSENSLSIRQLVELLARLGYAPDISLASGKKAKKKADRNFILRLGVAGFCFGNIMLLSLPEYLDFAQNLDPLYRQFFSYLNLVLALPVLLFSSRDYFVSAWKAVASRQINLDIPIALGIITLFSRSAYEIITHIGPGYMDSLAALLFFLLIGKWFQGKTYEALAFDRDYESYFPIGVTTLTAEGEKVVPLKDLQTGDRLLIRNQEIIPADSVLLKGAAQLDYSFVSGEAEPVRRQAGELLYAGGRQIGPTIEVEVKKLVGQSYLTQLWNQEFFHKNEELGLSSLASAISRRFTWGILVLSLATAAYWWWADPSMIVHTVTSVLIVACPCALALAMPFTMGNAMRIFGKKHLYLKNTEAIEKLAQADTIVFDKTGTLTEAKIRQIHWRGGPLTADEQQAVRSVTRHSGHPLSKALYEQLRQASPSVWEVVDFEEIEGKGLRGTVFPLNGNIPPSPPLTGGGNTPPHPPVNGGGNTVLLITEAGGMLTGDRGGSGLMGAGVPNTPPSTGGQGGVNGGIYIVLGSSQFVQGVAHIGQRNTSVYLAINGELKGFFEFEPAYREGFEQTIRALGQHYDLHLLSGDNDRERERLKGYFPEHQLHFNQSPMNKLTYVQQLAQQGRKVLMLGDGLNDAGALRQSHVGVAISEDVYHFSPACDAILDSGQFARLGKFLQFSKQSLSVVKISLFLSLAYNLIGISYAVSGVLTPVVCAILMPLSSISVVGFVTLATNWLGRK